MKNLPLNNTENMRLEAAFGQWLQTLGYASSSVYSLPLYLREFLHWTEQQELTLQKITPPDIQHFFLQLKNRKRQRRPGVLSLGHQYKHLQALRKFSLYLRQTEQAAFEVDVVLPTQNRQIKDLLTPNEIQNLYAACTEDPMGMRDRAMLSVYYGCGLRRNEGVRLNTTDILSEKKLLYVREGKNYKERYVPLSKGVLQDMENYLRFARPLLLKQPLEPAFFVSERGSRIQGQSLILRLKKLLKSVEIEKETGLHSLRHAIATHLLQSGMSLQHIARFLGHESLESTQIYTQLINEET